MDAEDSAAMREVRKLQEQVQALQATLSALQQQLPNPAPPQLPIYAPVLPGLDSRLLAHGSQHTAPRQYNQPIFGQSGFYVPPPRSIPRYTTINGQLERLASLAVSADHAAVSADHAAVSPAIKEEPDVEVKEESVAEETGGEPEVAEDENMSGDEEVKDEEESDGGGDTDTESSRAHQHHQQETQEGWTTNGSIPTRRFVWACKDPVERAWLQASRDFHDMWRSSMSDAIPRSMRELRDSTPYSLALAVKLTDLARIGCSRGSKRRTRAHDVLVQMWRKRVGRRPDLAQRYPVITSTARTFGKDHRQALVETTIRENLQGLMLVDVTMAIREYSKLWAKTKRQQKEKEATSKAAKEKAELAKAEEAKAELAKAKKVNADS